MSMVIEVGSTYQRKVGDNIEPVTLTSVCQYGGWYGIDANGKSIRVTEKSLVNNNPTVQEDTNMAKPTPKVTAADRRAKRATNGNTVTAEVSASEKLDMALSTAKPNPTPRKANGQIAAKPKAKPAPKPAAKAKPAAKPKPAAATESPVKPTPQSNNIKESNTMPVKSTRKPTAKPAPIATETVNIEALAAELAAKLVADMIASGELASTVEPVAKRSLKPIAEQAAAKTAKTVKVTLKAKNEKRHSWHFGFMGKAANPVCTGCYITKDAIAQFEAGAKSITVEFDRAEGKKHSILFREAGDSTVFNGSLYLMRNALNGSGITEDTPITVVATVKSESEITLTISAA